MDYCFYVAKIVIRFFSHPLVVGLTLFFIGKHFWLDKYLLSKQALGDFDIKKQTVYKIYLIKDKLKIAMIYYDRMVNTIKLARDNQQSSVNTEERLQRVIGEEIKQISPLLNNDILILHSEINSLISIYFKDKKGLHDSFDEYSDALGKIHKFMLSSEWFKNRTFKKSDDFSELSLENLTEKEKSFIEKLLNSDSIFIDKRKI